jgi:predicted porin
MKALFGKLAALTLPIACGWAHAQSNVTLYGVADMYAGRLKNEGGTAAQGSVGVVNSGGLTTSYLGFRGQEDMGNGLKALVTLETYVRMDTGATGRNDSDPLWGRAANVGISTPYGRLTMGRHVTPYSLAATNFTPFKGTTGISPIFSHTFKGNVLGDTRFNNSVRYTSPDWNGLELDVVGSLGREVDTGPDRHRERAVDASLKYIAGPLSLVTATRIINLNAADDDHEQKAYMGGAIYDFKFVRLNAQYHWTRETFRASIKDVRRKTYEVGAVVPAGPGEFWISWAASDIDHQQGPKVSDKRSSYAVAYDYNLSKRTDLYAVFFDDRLKHPLVLQRYAVVGMRHRF